MKNSLAKHLPESPIRLVPRADRIVPGITEGHAATIIDGALERIRQNMVLLSEKEGPMKEAEEYYLLAKKEVDTIKHQLDCDNLLVESFSRFKNKLLDDLKPLRTTRGESHNDMKDREKRKYKKQDFHWNEYAIEVLKAENKYLTPEELWQKVLARFNIAARMKESGNEKDLRKNRWGAIHNCWLNSCKKVRGGSTYKTLKLIDYKGTIGLLEWALDDYTPDSFHIRQFLSSAE
jgi:hypothetical protein